MNHLSVYASFEPGCVDVSPHYGDDGKPWAALRLGKRLSGVNVGIHLDGFEQVNELEAALGKVREHLLGLAASDASDVA